MKINSKNKQGDSPANQSVRLQQRQTAGLFQKNVRTIAKISLEYIQCRRAGRRCSYPEFPDNCEDVLKYNAEITFEKYRQQLLNESSPKEQHFGEAVKKGNALREKKRRWDRKRKGSKEY